MDEESMPEQYIRYIQGYAKGRQGAGYEKND